MSEPTTGDWQDPQDPQDPAPDAAVHEPAPDPVEPTGHPLIDEALGRLDHLPEREIGSHPEEFDAIHRVLREALANAGRDRAAPESP
jgi:hypothetical protein